MQNGQGTYIFADGSKYVGSFVDGSWVKLLLGMLEKHWRIDIMFQHFRLVGLALLLSIGVGSA